MNEPPVPPLNGLALELLRAEQSRPPAPAGAKENIRARLGSSIAGSAPSAVPRSRTSPIWRAGSLALAFAAGGVAGAAIHARLASTPAPVTPVRVEPPPARPTRAPAPLPVDEMAPMAVIPAPAPAHEAAPETGLGAERALLDKARAALGRGDNEECLAIVKTHTDAFARGRLAEEREALAVKALVNLGRAAEARRRGARFRAHYPRSLLLPAVESALDSIP
jgi:hypothetical protein